MRNSKVLTLLSLFISYIWVSTFARSVLPVHFLASGITIRQMLAGFLFMFLIQFLALLYVRKISAKIAWRMSIFSLFLSLAVFFNIKNDIQFYIGMMLGGLSLFFFFPIYNIVHFKNTSEGKIGTSSALMFSVGPIVSIFAPALAGTMAAIHFSLFWYLSTIFMILTLITINFQKDYKLNYSRLAVLAEIKATRPFIFLEGIWSALVLGIIPVYSLIFFKTPSAFGIFLAYFAAVSTISNLVLGKLTDKIKKRSIFLYPLTLILALTTMLFPFALKSLELWIFFTGIVGFVLPMFWNLATALVVDHHENLKDAMLGREIVLAIGRIVGLAITLFSFPFEKNPKYIFLFLGLSILLYPLILFYNQHIKKRYQYF